MATFKYQEKLMRTYMKPLVKSLFTLLILGFIISCGKSEQSIEDLVESKDLEAIRKKKVQLSNQLNSLNTEIRSLDEAIAELDPNLNYQLVKSMAVKDTIFEHYISIQSSIESDQDVNVLPEYSGIMRLNVSEGSYVRRGAVLATINDGGLSESLTQAEIGVSQSRSEIKRAEIQRDLAKTTYLKQKSLWDKKIGSEIQFLQAKTEYEAAEKGVTIARQSLSSAQQQVGSVREQLAKTRVYAPFSGVVEEILTENGQVASPSTPIIRLVNTANVKAVANVPEVYLPFVRRGTKAIIYLPSLDRYIDGSVGLVGSSINADNRTFKVEIPVQNSDGLVKPNLNAQIKINDYSNEKVVVIPESIVRQDGKGDYIFKKEKKGDKFYAKKVYVSLGKRDNGKVEILNGLKSGELLIVRAPAKLDDGGEVKEATT